MRLDYVRRLGPVASLALLAALVLPGAASVNASTSKSGTTPPAACRTSASASGISSAIVVCPPNVPLPSTLLGHPVPSKILNAQQPMPVGHGGPSAITDPTVYYECGWGQYCWATGTMGIGTVEVYYYCENLSGYVWNCATEFNECGWYSCPFDTAAFPPSSDQVLFSILQGPAVEVTACGCQNDEEQCHWVE